MRAVHKVKQAQHLSILKDLITVKIGTVPVGNTTCNDCGPYITFLQVAEDESYCGEKVGLGFFRQGLRFGAPVSAAHRRAAIK